MRTLKQERAAMALVVCGAVAAVVFLGGKFFWKAEGEQDGVGSAASAKGLELSERLEPQRIISNVPAQARQHVLGDVMKSGTLSDREEKWLTAQLRRSSGVRADLLSAQVIVENIKSLAPMQKTRLFGVCREVLAEGGAEPSWRKQVACALLGKIGDRHAMSLLMPLLQGPPSRMQEQARDTLRQLDAEATARGK